MRRQLLMTAVLGAVLGSVTAGAQAVPWDVYDHTSGSRCDVINASNVELVVLADTGELVIITGLDTILGDTYVDLEGNVYYLDEPAGFIEWAIDGDGFYTLWWRTLTGWVVEVDEFTGEPYVSDLFPGDFYDVPCNACEYWDDQTDCAIVVPDDNNGDTTVIINPCGAAGMIPLLGMFTGLVGMRLARGRRQ